MVAQASGVVIVGGGQAGLALSYHLTAQGQDHVVLEQGRIAESWRTKRWDSLRLIAPNWSLRLPGFAYAGDDPDGFMGKDEVVTHLEVYARSFAAPVHEGVRVLRVSHNAAGTGFVLHTEDGGYAADQVVIATGALQQPRLPSCAKHFPAAVAQMPASTYRNPWALPPGAVLIVGNGETGCQIAEELARAGRSVSLSGGRAWWAPRHYRGRDIAAWDRAVGWFDRLSADLPPGARTGQSNPQLTGSGGGHDISPHTLARDGVQLLGRLLDVHHGNAIFATDLEANLAWGDEQARQFLHQIDDVIDTQQLEAPDEAWPSDLRLNTDFAQETPVELDLAEAGIGAVIWATGYRPDLTWLGLPILDDEGYPIQRRGVTALAGLYILGLDWLHTAKSGLFAGIGEDAAHLAAVIADRATAA